MISIPTGSKVSRALGYTDMGRAIRRDRYGASSQSSGRLLRQLFDIDLQGLRGNASKAERLGQIAFAKKAMATALMRTRIVRRKAPAGPLRQKIVIPTTAACPCCGFYDRTI